MYVEEILKTITNGRGEQDTEGSTQTWQVLTRLYYANKPLGKQPGRQTDALETGQVRQPDLGARVARREKASEAGMAEGHLQAPGRQETPRATSPCTQRLG